MKEYQLIDRAVLVRRVGTQWIEGRVRDVWTRGEWPRMSVAVPDSALPINETIVKLNSDRWRFR